LLFVTLPFVVRTVQPVLLELDHEMEEAAASLGAGRPTIFRRIVFPHLLPALLSGVALAFARAIGEFGAVILIAGNLPFKTEVASLYVFQRINSDDATGAAALAMLLLAPVGLIFWRAFEHGWHPFWAAISNPDAVHALKLTLEVAVVAVPLNTIFGVLCALAIVRHRIPGMGFVNAIVDLPMALSPVVVGLSLYLLYGRDGWFGGWLTAHGIKVLFAYPGMLLATMFVSLPFVV